MEYEYAFFGKGKDMRALKVKDLVAKLYNKIVDEAVDEGYTFEHKEIRTVGSISGKVPLYEYKFTLGDIVKDLYWEIELIENGSMKAILFDGHGEPIGGGLITKDRLSDKELKKIDFFEVIRKKHEEIFSLTSEVESDKVQEADKGNPFFIRTFKEKEEQSIETYPAIDAEIIDIEEDIEED